MQKRLYLFVVAALCSMGAFALDINTMQGAGDDRSGMPEPADTSSHRVFHSKFGDDVQFPRLTNNASENAVILGKFFSEISKKKNIPLNQIQTLKI